MNNINFWRGVIESNAHRVVEESYTLGDVKMKKQKWVEKAYSRILELSEGNIFNIELKKNPNVISAPEYKHKLTFGLHDDLIKKLIEEVIQEMNSRGQEIEDYTQNDLIDLELYVPGAYVFDCGDYTYYITLTEKEEETQGLTELTYSNALDIFKTKEVYLMYADGSEALAESEFEMKRHRDHGGWFGYEK